MDDVEYGSEDISPPMLVNSGRAGRLLTSPPLFKQPSQGPASSSCHNQYSQGWVTQTPLSKVHVSGSDSFQLGKAFFP